MKKSIPVLGALGIIITVAGIMLFNPYFLVAGTVLAAIAIIMFTGYLNEQTPDIEDVPDLSKAKVTKLNVADLGSHMDDFMSLAMPNPDYALSEDEIKAKDLSDTMIYEYNFPDNPELRRGFSTEENQEPVEVYLGGKLIGAIPMKKSSYIYVLVGMKGIRYMEAEITGGKYKILRNGKMEIGKRDYHISLTIYADA